MTTINKTLIIFIMLTQHKNRNKKKKKLNKFIEKNKPKKQIPILKYLYI